MHKCILFNVCSPGWAGRSAGPYRIAHVLRENGWDCEVIEFATAWTDEELKQLAKSRIDSDTKFIGFGHLFSIWPENYEAFCAWIKEQWPHIKIISGSSVLPVFDSKTIDYYIQGFAEVAILELTKYLFSNGSMPKFDLQLKLKGKWVIAANDVYPAYPLKSLMIKYEDRDFIQPGEWLTMEFSRGCKFHCAFCNYPILGVKGDYSRDAEDARANMQEIYDKYGVYRYTVSDETFNDRTEKITKFADMVEQLSFRPWFSGYIRADLLISRPKDREELLRMNFLGHFYGVESFNTASSRAVGKGMDGDRMKAGLIEVKKYFQNNGTGLYRGNLGLIIGLPHESIESIYQTRDWLNTNWSDQAFDTWGLEIPTKKHRGSKISEDMTKYGYKRMSTEEIIQNYDEKTRMADFTQIIPWQNDHMNYFQARKIETEINTMYFENRFRLSTFALSGIATNMHNMEELLQVCPVDVLKDIKYNFDIPDRSNPRYKMIDNYIKRKLSL